MAYQTGTALNANDLLDKIRVFALSQGWTIHGWAVRSDGGGSGGWCLLLGKADIHFALYADLGADSTGNPGQKLGGYLYPAYSGAHGNMAQPNKSANIYGNGLGMSQYVAYHFFAGPEHIHVTIEVTTGVYKHFGIGRLRRLGNVNTGAYLYVSNWRSDIGYINNPLTSFHAIPFDSAYNYGYSRSTVIMADSDAATPRYLYATEENIADRLICGYRNASETLPILNLSASTLTGRATLWPVLVAARRLSSSLYSPIGQPPDLRWVRLDYLNPGEALTLGTDEWMIFPVIRKNGGLGEPNSGVFGIAFKK